MTDPLIAKLYLRTLVGGTEDTNGVFYDGSAETIEVFLGHEFVGGVNMWVADGEVPTNSKFEASTAVWSLYGPDGPGDQDPGGIFLSDNLGSVDDPKTFTPTMPGRWLIKLVAQQYVLDPDTGLTVLDEEPRTYTALYEIQDPNIIGHRNARPYGNGSVTRGASTIAPNESTEYDSDEGWSRGIERYLTTVSREQGFRRTAVVLNSGPNPVAAGKLLTIFGGPAVQKWKSCISGMEDFQNTIIRVQQATCDPSNPANPRIDDNPLFLALEDIEVGERGVALVEGVVPYDTTTLADHSVLYCDHLGEFRGGPPSSLNATYLDVKVGKVTKGHTSDDEVEPGSVYFHGYTQIMPGLITGPISSDNNAVATWVGTDGDELQSTKVRIYEEGGFANNTVLAAEKNLEVRSFGDGYEVKLLTGGTTGVGVPSGTTSIETGAAQNSSTGDLNLGTGESITDSSGNVNIQPGQSELAGGEVEIVGGTSTTAEGGNVTLKGGTASTAGQAAGNVIIQGGVNTPDSARGSVQIQNADTLDVGIASEINLTAPVVRTLAGESRWLAVDTLGVGPTKPKAYIYNEYGVNTQFYLVDEAGSNSLELNSDSNSYILNKLSIGTTAPPAGADQLVVDGSATFTDLTVTNKLNVGGLIDPIGLILTPTENDLIPVAGGEGAIFVADGSDGLTEGELYFKSADPVIGTLSLVSGAAPGEIMIGPFAAGSTIVDQVATWQTTDGDTLQGSGIIITADGEIRSIVDPVTNLAGLITIKPNDHATGGDADGKEIYISAGDPEGAGAGGRLVLMGANATGGAPGPIQIYAGSSMDAAEPGADVHIESGTGNGVVGQESDGGGLTAQAAPGAQHGGDLGLLGGNSIYPDGEAGIGPGGRASIRGGVGGRDGQAGGDATIQGGPGADGNPAVYRGGVGGDVNITAGSAGTNSGFWGGNVIIRAGSGDALDPGIWGLAEAGQGGEVMIRSGDSPDGFPGMPHGKGGANILLTAGDAGNNSGGDGGHIVIEPGNGDPALGGAAMHGVLHMCGGHIGVAPAVSQKSYVAIGSQLLSGIGPVIGMCAGQLAHTIHGNLKVTGLLDPSGFLMEPQSENPSKVMLQAAMDAGAVDADGDPIDINDPESQRQIKNTLWQDAGNNDLLMLGDEPVGTQGTVTYSFVSVTYDPDQALLPSEYVDSTSPDYDPSMETGHLVGDLTPAVHYVDVPEKVSIVAVDASLGDVAVMLPMANQHPGRTITIKDKTGTSNVPGHGQILIVPHQPGETLDQYEWFRPSGSSPGPYPVQPWAAVECWSDGTAWFIV